MARRRAEEPGTAGPYAIEKAVAALRIRLLRCKRLLKGLVSIIGYLKKIVICQIKGY
jgi:hypothetical protein